MSDTALQILKAERPKRVAAIETAVADLVSLDETIETLEALSNGGAKLHVGNVGEVRRALDVVTEKPVIKPNPAPVAQPAPTPAPAPSIAAGDPAAVATEQPEVAPTIAAAPVAPWEQGAGEAPAEKPKGRRTHEQMAADAGVTLDEVKGWKERQGHTETKIVKADIEAAGAAKKSYLDSLAGQQQAQAPQEQPSAPAPAPAPQAAVAQPVQPAPTPSGPIQAQDFPTEPMQTEEYQAPAAPQAQQQAAQPAAAEGAAPVFSSPW